MKITICGAGRVGSIVAFECFRRELGNIVLYNRTAKTAKGIALDIQESGPLLDTDVKITGTGDFRQTKNSDVVVITAGAQRKEGMSRADVLDTNAKIVREITKNIAIHSKNAVIIVVSNPLDAMVFLVKKISKFPKNRVVGMAGMLDTSRFKSFIADELRMSVEDVHTLVLGSHGDFMVPLPGHTSVNGVPLQELMPKNKINQLIRHTRKAGAEIISLENSSAFFSPGVSVAEMVESIVKDKKRVMHVQIY